MCGISGIFDPLGRLQPIVRMTTVQSHRGPDDEGYVFGDTSTGRNREAGGADTNPFLRLPPCNAIPAETFDLVLGSRRLAILDLTPAGHMPLSRDGGALWITHNGEVYNYLELRDELKALGHKFTSDTDTEVILAAYEEWGCECLTRFNGMFAFAIWDARRGTLFCARDRFGVKPLYYWWDGKTFVFASELKSVLAHPLAPRVPNESIICDYLVLGKSDHTSQTFFDGIEAVPAAHYLTLDFRGRQISLRRWWALDINPDLSSAIDDEQTVGTFRSMLQESIRIRLRSDVPVGTCLSGGVDSSSIVCLANKFLRCEGNSDAVGIRERQKTFTARNASSEIDEYRFSHEIVRLTGAEENTVLPTPERLWQDVTTFIWHMDEPVHSTSQYPQWSVMRLARERGMTVLLDGQGGDELLAGYQSYWPAYLSQVRRDTGLPRCASSAWNAIRVGGRPVANVVYQYLVPQAPWRIQQLLTAIAPPRTELGQSGSGLQQGQLAPELIRRFHGRLWKPAGPVDSRGLAGTLHRDLTSENLPMLLRFEDRNSMAFSLETRLPFLDYRLVESVFALPLNFRMRHGWTKWILRTSLKGVLPPEIAWRRSKLGFPVPERDWLTVGAPFIRDTLRRAGKQSLGGYIRRGLIEEICRRPDDILASTPGLWRMLNLVLWFEAFILESNGFYDRPVWQMSERRHRQVRLQ